MVDFVRPNYLGTKAEFTNMFQRPIENGQCVDSTEADRKLMQGRAHVLHELLSGFVQRRSHAVLKASLPPKQEIVLMVRMSPLQRRLYTALMNHISNSSNMYGTVLPPANTLQTYALCCKVSRFRVPMCVVTLDLVEEITVSIFCFVIYGHLINCHLRSSCIR